MTTTQRLHDLGQSLWLDNITRDMLDNGTLRRYIDELSVTGLTSNPTIFDEAIGGGSAYDRSIRQKAKAGLSGEALFVDLALEDLRRAADLFRRVHDRTAGLDGWVSMEVSPLLADDTKSTLEAARRIHKLADRPNLYVKIPGTPAGAGAIEEAIFAGVPVNVTLLFSREQYLVAAEAYMRGIERRIAAGLDARVSSVASLFVSRWDQAVAEKVPRELQNRLGIAIATRTYRAHCELVAGKRWRDLAAAGARKQRMLWASTGTKDPKAPPHPLRRGAGGARHHRYHARKDAARVRRAGTDQIGHADRRRGCRGRVGALYRRRHRSRCARAQLQVEGAQSFVKSWTELMQSIAEKSAALATS